MIRHVPMLCRQDHIDGRFGWAQDQWVPKSLPCCALRAKSVVGLPHACLPSLHGLLACGQACGLPSLYAGRPKLLLTYNFAAGGRTEGDIRVNGHPKVQATFARVSGYVEQTGQPCRSMT